MNVSNVKVTQMTQQGAILAIMPVSISQEELEGTKEVIRIGNGRRRDNTIAKRKRTKGQTTIYKALHRKLKIKQHPTKN